MVGTIVIILKPKSTKGAVSSRHRLNLYKSSNLIGGSSPYKTEPVSTRIDSPNNLRRRKGSPPKWKLRAQSRFYSKRVGPSPRLLNPQYVTGFTDAEGCFEILIRKDSRCISGDRYNYNLCFSIGLHKKDRPILESIQMYFNGIGSITKQGNNAVRFRVTSLVDLLVIINHFDKFPLITQKQGDYQLFKKAFDLISRKEHLTKEGFDYLLALKASINKGFSASLQKVFPKVIPAPRPIVKDQEIPDPH